MGTLEKIKNGESFKFYGRRYAKGAIYKLLRVGDEVIIHPVLGKSTTNKSYPAKVVVQQCPYAETGDTLNFTNRYELCCVGINDNIIWHGAVINEYLFNRLEFVRHTC